MSLKYSSNFWRTLDMPLINYKVSLTITWSENCLLKSRTHRKAVAGNNPEAEINNPTGATFKIKGKILCSSCYSFRTR